MPFAFPTSGRRTLLPVPGWLCQFRIAADHSRRPPPLYGADMPPGYPPVAIWTVGIGMGSKLHRPLSLYYRIPVLTAWSAPGAALLHRQPGQFPACRRPSVPAIAYSLAC